MRQIEVNLKICSAWLICQILCGFSARGLTVCGKRVQVHFPPFSRMRKPWWQLVTKLYNIFITSLAVLKWQCAIFNLLLYFVVKSTTSNILITSLFLPRILLSIRKLFFFPSNIKKKIITSQIFHSLKDTVCMRLLMGCLFICCCM